MHDTRQTKAAFALCSANADIGGPTTWLQTLLHSFKPGDGSFSLLIQYFPSNDNASFTESYLYKALHGSAIGLTGSNVQSFTEDGISDAIKFLNETRPQVFLPQCRVDLNFAAIYAASFGLPWVYTLHADNPEFWAMATDASACPDRSVWVAVSQHIGTTAKTRFPDMDVRVIPYGTAIPSQSASFNKYRFTVIYLGRIQEEQKRISLVVQAFVAACQLDSRINVQIIGDGTDRPKMEAYVSESGLADRIHFLGRLDPTDVATVLLRAQATLLMSDYEGLPIALLEAMACGLVPVVREISSGIPELVQDGVTGVVISDSPDEAAQRIVDLASDADLWQRLSRNARAHITAKYSSAQSNSMWLRLIDEMSRKSYVSYPLPLPRKLNLPAVKPVLARMDRRRPTTLAIALGFVRRIRGRIVTKLRALRALC